jgi:hypothetical protein
MEANIGQLWDRKMIRDCLYRLCIDGRGLFSRARVLTWR